jgi:hypothetical protein
VPIIEIFGTKIQILEVGASTLRSATWAGRGARPVWLVAAIKGGKKLDDFLIDKSPGKGRKKRRAKR